MDLRVLWWNTSWQHAGRLGDQIEAVRRQDPPANLIALSEVDERRADCWRTALESEGFFLYEPDGLDAKELRVLLACRLSHSSPSLRFAGLEPRALCSIAVELDVVLVDVHAVQIPNGRSYGWRKIEHLEALRTGFEPPHPRPQVLVGDFNTPRREIGERIITWGETWEGKPMRPRRPYTKWPYSEERPWDPVLWDKGERAVLEGLPRECGMRDVFRVENPTANDVSWVPRGAARTRGRRLDRVYASQALRTVECRYLHEWRERGLSDHSPLFAQFVPLVREAVGSTTGR